MTWARLDDSFCDHPKVDHLTDGAFRLHVAAICDASRFLTDGFINKDRPQRLVRRYKPSLAAELVAAGVWNVTPDGWVIHDYKDWNPSAEQVRKVQAERVAAGSKGGSTKASNRLANARANGKANAVAKPKQTSSTIPSLKSPTDSGEDEARERRLARTHWEATKPSPAIKFIALMKIIERFCEAGWTDEQILSGLARTRAYTIDSIEYALRETAGASKPLQVSESGRPRE